MAKTKKKTRPLIWISGNYYESRKYWRQVCRMLGDDTNIDTLDCMDGTILAGDVILRLKNKDIFDSRPRILRLNGLPHDYASIADYLHLVDNTNVLVIDGPFKAKAKPPATKPISVTSSKLYKTFKSEGKLLESPVITKTDLEAKNWVNQVLKDLDRSIDQEALNLLVDMEGRNCDHLFSTVNKLCDYSSKKKLVVEDINACCVPSFYEEVWSLIKYLDCKEHNDAVCHMQKFHSSAGSEPGTTYYGDVQKMLGALFQHFLFIMALKDSCGSQISYKGAENAIVGLKKRVKKADKYQWQDFFSSAYMKMSFNKPGVKQAFSWSKKEIYTALREILRCQRLCRTRGGSDSKIRLYVDTMILGICGKLSEDQVQLLVGDSSGMGE